MAGAIGEAFVRVRPDTSTFKQETSSGVKDALLGAGKVLGGIFAVRELEQGVRAVARAAASQQEELAVVRNAVEQNNAAWRVHGKTVEDVLRDQAVQFGFTVADLSQGFTRIETGTRDTEKSFDLLNLAMDISRARHLGLAQSAIVVTRAAQGNDLAIRRLGIIIPKTTEHYTALRREHDRLVAAGAKFDKQQTFAYKTALAQAKALDDQANKTRVITELQARFGGQSTAFANTAAGSFQSLHEALNELEVSIGNALIPALTEGAVEVSHLFKEIADSQDIQEAASSAAHALAEGYEDVKAVVEALAPVLKTAVHGLEDIAQFTGAGGAIALVAGFKGAGLAIDLARTAEAKFNDIIARGERITLTQAGALDTGSAAYNAHTASVERNTAALAGNVALAERSTLALRASAVPLAAAGPIAVEGGLVRSASNAGLLAAALGDVEEGAQGAAQSLLDVSSESVGLTNHSLEIAKRLNDVGGATVKTSANLAGLTTTQIRHVAALEASIGPSEAARVATIAQATAYDTLAGSLGAATAATAGFEATSAAAAGSFGRLGQKEVEAAGGARLLVPASADVGKGFKQIGEEAERTGFKAQTLGSRLKVLSRGVGATIFGLVGGTTGLLIAAIAGATFAIYKLITAESALDRSNDSLKSSVGDLADDFTALAKSAEAYQSALKSVSSDKIAVSQARLSLEQARTALATTDARKGTHEYTEVLIRAAQANDQYRAALAQLRTDQKLAAASERDHANAIRASHEDTRRALAGTRDLLEHATNDIGGFAAKVGGFFESIPLIGKHLDLHTASEQGFLASLPGQEEVVRRVSKAFQEQADTLRNEHHPALARQFDDVKELITVLGHVPKEIITNVFVRTGSARSTLEAMILQLNRAKISTQDFIRGVETFGFSISQTDPALSKQSLLIGEVTRNLGRYVSAKERARVTRLVLDAKDFKTGVQAAIIELQRIKGIDPGSKTGREFVSSFLRELITAGLANKVGDLLGVVNAKVAGVADITEAAVKKADADRKLAQSAFDAANRDVKEQAEAYSQAVRRVADAQQSLADAIRQGNQSVHDSIVSAASNLSSIGSTLESSIDEFIDAENKLGNHLSAGSPAGKEFKRLTDELKNGGAGPELERHAKTLQARLEAESVAGSNDLDKRKENVHRHIEDLIDLFNKGAIGTKEFNKRLAKILEGEGVSYKKAGRLLGIAFADGFQATLNGLRKQIQAIAAGPRLKGLEVFEPSIVRPLDAVRQRSRDIADARRELGDALKDSRAARQELEKEQATANRLNSRLTDAATKLADLHAKFAKLEAAQKTILKGAGGNVARITVPVSQIIADMRKAGLIDDFASLGLDAGKGIARGLTESKKDVRPAAHDLGESILRAIREHLKIQSPSKVTEAAGLDVGRGLAKGLRESRPIVETAAQALGREVLQEVHRVARQLERERFHVHFTGDLTPPEVSPQRAAQPPGVRGGRPEPRPTPSRGGLDVELLSESRAQTRVQRQSERHLGAIATEERKQTDALRKLGAGGGRQDRPNKKGDASREARVTTGLTT